MTTLPPYRGFQGAVEYDAGALFIRLLHIDDAVSAICEAASQVETTFKELVDDYIETCKEIGVEPNRPFKGSFNIRIKPSLHRDAAMAAAANNQTLNSWMEQAVKAKLDPDSTRTMPLVEVDLGRANEEPEVPSEQWVAASQDNVASLDEFREMLGRKQGSG